MGASVAEILYVLKRLKDRIQKDAAVVKTVKVDDESVDSFKIKKFDLSIESLTMELEYTLPDSKKTGLTARHVFRSDEADEVKINGKSMGDCDVDLDVDFHLLRADFEYRVKYSERKPRKKDHEIFLLASVDWYSV
jgi:hypothetical protein